MQLVHKQYGYIKLENLLLCVLTLTSKVRVNDMSEKIVMSYLNLVVKRQYK